MTGTSLTVRRGEPTAITSHAPALDQAFSMGELLQMAELVIPTGLLPEHIKTPGHFLAIVLSGREMGMPTFRALKSLQMVKGKVQESADSQLARFKSDGGRAQFRVLTETEAVLWLRHPNGDEHVETFTIEDAKRAGLLQNNQWRNYPKAMLRSRAITAGLKSLGWEGGVGVYDPSEFSVETPAERTFSAAPLASAVDDESVAVQLHGASYVAPTLEEALEMVLPGAPDKWNGNGGKRLAELSPRLLVKAEQFFRKAFQKKLDESGEYDERTLRLADALQVAAEWRGEEEARGMAGQVLEGGRVEDALALGDEPRRPRNAIAEGH